MRSQFRFIGVFLLVSTITTTAATATTTASASSSSTVLPSFWSVDQPKRRLKRSLRSWSIRKRRTQTKRRSLLDHTSIGNRKGSVLTWKRPTKQNLADWFGVEEEGDDVRRLFTKEQFNHEWVGMTNPYLQLDDAATVGEQYQQLLLSSEDNSRNDNHEKNKPSLSSSWWPGLSFLDSSSRSNKTTPKSSSSSSPWRIRRYTKQVGVGKECYERVRDAAMDWEFMDENEMHNTKQNHESSDLGLLRVPKAWEVQQNYHDGSSKLNRLRRRLLPSRQQRTSSLPHRMISKRPYTISAATLHENEEPIVSCHLSVGAPRRLVSYASQPSQSSWLSTFLPKIYSINPVMVTYDLMDQRAPLTTFSSTAYATMKGHFLRGEERVTVAIRDETQAVEVEILSMSRPGDGLKARMIWPFVGNLQETFFQKQLEHLERVGEQQKQ